MDNMAKEYDVTIKGIAPLIMHRYNFQTGQKRKKTTTPEGYKAMHRKDWEDALYTDSDGFVIIPCDSLWSMVVEGARKSRNGKQATFGMFVEADARLKIRIERAMQEAKADDIRGIPKFIDKRRACIKKAAVDRVRPIFPEWELTFRLQISTDVFGEEAAMQALSDAGRIVGLCDYRPRYGRFTVAKIEEVR